MSVTFTERGEGPAVLLLHGESSTPASWEPLAYLLEPWMRVVIADVPSGGEPSALAEGLRTLLVVEDGTFAVVGQGRGGVIAQHLAVGEGSKAMILIGCPAAEDISAELEALDDVPTFLLWGEDDEVVPSIVGERLCEAIQGSTMALVPESGHDLLDTDGETIFPLIYEWLRFRYLGRSHGHDEGGPVPIQILTTPPSQGRG